MEMRDPRAGAASSLENAPPPASSQSCYFFPIILASSFCCLLFSGTLRILELSGRDRNINNYPSQNNIRAVRELPNGVEVLIDFSWSGSGIW